MTTTASALNQISLRATRGSHGTKTAMLLAPVLLAVLVVASMLLSVHQSGGALGVAGLIWFCALGALALGAGALRDAAFGAFDSVREAQENAAR